jgi:hypothetical protein
MTASFSVSSRSMKVLRVMAAASFAGLLPLTASAQPTPPTTGAPTTAPSDSTTAPTTLSREEWEKAIARIPPPKRGCFTSTYPRLEWQEVPCTTPPNHPYPPARGPRPQTVGNNTDFAAEVTGTLSGADGSFDSVSATSVSGNYGGNPPAKADVFSLQLNTKPFTTPACSSNPSCKGWQQFIYSNGDPSTPNGVAFIQYWLLRYNTTCPAGWNTHSFSSSSDIDCWQNSPGGASVMPRQTITNLASLRLTGNAVAGGLDTVTLTFPGGSSASATNDDSVLNLAPGWKGVEFIVAGDCCNSVTNFNAGSTIVVRTTTHSGTTNAPNCVLEGFSGETNNLNLVGTAAVTAGAAPAIVSTQSNAPGSAASCATATGVGEPHLTTFRGLLYDFQATGDFVLAETGPDFVVQARQVSGAPTWPNAAINKAVAVQAGKTRVAICTTDVAIHGKRTRLADGKLVAFPDGGDVVRRGNVFVVRAPSGDSMRAVVNGNYIDVTVGLGRWPSKVRGLLANAPTGEVSDIETRDGTVLTSPFAFKDLYGRYADSWRVAENASLLSPCGATKERGAPQKPFFANNLDEKRAARSRAICLRAGVKEGPLLDACMIDVTVIGPKAANVFVGAPNPIAVGDAR